MHMYCPTVRLSDLQTMLNLRLVEISCRKCQRRGQLSVARLIREYGGDAPLPDFALKLAKGCPLLDSISIYDRCGAHMPNIGFAIDGAMRRNRDENTRTHTIS
jgi:hypothetical protein